MYTDILGSEGVRPEFQPLSLTKSTLSAYYQQTNVDCIEQPLKNESLNRCNLFLIISYFERKG